ncbi:Trk-type K+ transport system, membrane component [Fictibacillus macauensis ZFHKF-1]|uniref:Trk-type K+ transport system, membrane component n=1 Tax=Fictibacillus macauensis ZFHKF-1 TaxID=1196324 RepID=I8UFV9_9BACL|nr:TrkH family potassium uptake protein [Fictibacillus macauensis]EIT85785.1 Trk-type K+ transport system, membrane component [Fictibacillus macauensis ZFHKF-1]
MGFSTSEKRKSFLYRPIKLTPPQTVALIFLTLVVVGGCLLKLPISTVKGIDWIDAFFTAVSAATVTGLVTVDPGSTFTIFGQVVILFLIQVGGIGIMSFAILVVIMLGKKIGIKQRLIMQEALNQPSIGGVIRLVRNLLLFSISIEAIAVLFLSIRWVPDLGFAKGIYYSIFHTIAAYNNAGFGLWPDNLTRYVGDPTVNLVITLLIMTGGLGFTVLVDLWYSREWRNLSLHSKVMIISTFAVNVVAVVLIYLFEYNNPHTLGALSPTDKLWAAYFQGISPRTAGFNTIDIGSMRQDSALLMVILMFIGAGSTSTGGGIKLTTFIVILFAVITFLRGKEHTTIMKRTIRNAVILRALAIATLSMMLVFVGTLLLTMSEHAPLMTILFEVASAFGTVGLTMNFTATLSLFGKCVIICIMFLGKIGPLTLAFSLARPQKANIRYPDGELFTG